MLMELVEEMEVLGLVERGSLVSGQNFGQLLETLLADRALLGELHVKLDVQVSVVVLVLVEGHALTLDGLHHSV